MIHPVLTSTRIGKLTLKNRAAVAPMTRVSAYDRGVPTANMARYYAAYAEGGFGLVITEGTYPDTRHSQAYAKQVGIATDEQQSGWRTVVEAVHKARAPIILQLMHAGALSQHLERTLAPSAIKPRGRMLSDYGGEGPFLTPGAMSEDDIHAAIDGFVAAARRAVEVGFDGVELHGANGYLLDQFITDYTNTRSDGYGGTVENRVRFVAEAISAVREEVGIDFPVGVRLSQGKVNDFSHRWPGGAEDARAIYRAVREAGVDYLHIASEGRNWRETALLSDGRTSTQLAREVTGLPVIANGGMHEPSQAHLVLDEGHADLVALATGAIANPDWPRRLADRLPLEPFEHGMISPDVTIEGTERWREQYRPASKR